VKNQLSILESFQELGWPAHNGNPLTGGDNVDARDRRHDTIWRLNNHVGRVILFLSDGLGQGITRELRNPKAPKKRPRSAPTALKKRARSAPLHCCRLTAHGTRTQALRDQQLEFYDALHPITASQVARSLIHVNRVGHRSD
jgi:hypothetical protein